MTAIFLDTTILVDRIISKDDTSRIDPIRKLLAGYDFLLACTYSRLEMKRVVLQNLQLTLRYLIEERSFFGAMRRASRLQQERRVATLVNIMAFVGSGVKSELEVTQGENADLKLALEAESFIRNAIRYLWRRFDKSVGSVLNKTACTRAAEGPEIAADGNVDVSIRKSKCKDATCNNANFLRSNLPDIRKLCLELERMKSAGSELTGELDSILQTFRRIEHDLDKAYDYKTCLAIGDLWIHLESRVAGVKEFCTRNYKESQILCPQLGLEMRLPE